jgi:hypothetical protein
MPYSIMSPFHPYILPYALCHHVSLPPPLSQAIADYMPIGMGLLLRNNESGYFLGDVKWGANNAHNGFGVLTRCDDDDDDNEIIQMVVVLLIQIMMVLMMIQMIMTLMIIIMIIIES